MNIVFYSYPHFFDPAISFVDGLTNYANTNFILELSPYSWQSSMFDLPQIDIPEGILDGKKFLQNYFSEDINKIFTKLKSFHLVFYKNKKSISYGSVKNSLKTAKFIKSLKPDIIHFDGFSLKASYSFKSLSKFPIICNIHDPFAHSGENNWRKSLANGLTYPYIKYFVLFNKYFSTEFSKYNKIHMDKIILSKLGVYDLFHRIYKNENIDEDGSVLFVGRLSKYKGLEVFFQTAKLISENYSGIKFVVAGKPYPGYKIPEIPNLSNNQLIIIDNYLSNKQLSELVQKSSMVVCPYLDATQSGVILTAYAFNKPVIATNVGGLPEYVWHNETGLIVPPNDPYSLRDEILKLLESPEIRNRMKLNIENKKQNELNWNRITERMVNIYSEIINKK